MKREQEGFSMRWWRPGAAALGVAIFFLAMWSTPTPVESLPHSSSGVHGLSSMAMASSSYAAPEYVNTTAKISKYWRTGYHFQPKKNWMNDPNGPLFYKGYYHLFYQYDPFSALWGNITWGHAVSTDLIHWKYLDDAAIQGGPGWYDILGAWSGSATILADGSPAIMYTGWSNVSDVFQIQTQNLVHPVDPSDPLLRSWYKSPHNPVIVADLHFQNATKFRDPTQGWRGKDGQWRILLGGKELGQGVPDAAGTAYVYKSPDFTNWTYVHMLHFVNGTGMWECPDFYPVALAGKKGLDISVNNGLIKHVVKVSLDDLKHDSYALGTYDEETDTFTADDVALDVGVGLRYDYGKFYASKTFFDHHTSRRILLGWINESTSDQNAVIADWSGVQAIPREIWLDKTQTDLIQTPVEEVDGLHREKVSKSKFTLSPGSVVPVDGVGGAQLDVQVKFYKPKGILANNIITFNGTNAAAVSAQDLCSQKGAAMQTLYGPFGFLVLAAKDMEEQTAVYFYLTTDSHGDWQAILCSDNSRSSLQIGVDNTTYGSYVKVLESETYLTLRTLVDHSIVESFAQGGRTVITSRVYPTLAVDDAAQFFLFNNGTMDIEVHSFNAWKMANINIVQF